VTELVVGILVGGRGSRLGGVAKGLLHAPDSGATLIERLLGELESALPTAPIVLLGQAEAYAALGLQALSDAAPGIGPLGGVVRLLEFAEQRGARAALALTCDLPRVGRAVLARLASEAPGAAALVTTQAGVRNPLVARYGVSAALPAAHRVLSSGSRSVQVVLDALGDGVATLPMSAEEEASLADWDEPADLR
jgi:molybdopterin-guanine dinucleotide biosynthesis protein A